MARNRVIYACQGLFVGPAPETGYNFLTHAGVLNNDHTNLSGNHNLLKQVDRITAVNYEIDLERIDIKQIGKRGTVARPLINQPTIKLNVDYILNGVKNEARLGFNVNFAQYQNPYSGEAYYNNRVSPISGIVYPSFTQPTGEPYWPNGYKEPRNIYLVTAPEGQDLMTVGGVQNTQGTDPRVTDFTVLSFGGCFIESYRTSARVGDVARASISFDANNVIYYSSGSGIDAPALNPETRQNVTGIKVVIPDMIDEGDPAAIAPGDITVNITGLTNTSFDISNSQITSYEIDFNLNSEKLYTLGYKNCLSRKINFPLFVNFNIETTVSESQTGNLVNLLEQDKKYDININLRNRNCPGQGDIAIRYDLLNSSFESVNFSSDIGSNKTARLNFTTEIDPLWQDKGFFISGLLNITKLEDYLLDEDGNFITDEEGNKIIINLIPLF